MLSSAGYDSPPDPYCYAGTTVLINSAGIRDLNGLEEFEARMVATRVEEPFPPGDFDVPRYQGLHRHLFQDVYAWAGAFRTVRIGKGDSMFCPTPFSPP